MMVRFRSLAARRPAALALVAAASTAAAGMAWSPAAAAGSLHPARPLFAVTISAIDRDGTPISTDRAAVVSVSGVSYLSSGNIAHVPAGTYIVAAPIWRLGDGSTQTLVAKKVRVTANRHVTLSAVGAVPVSASVSVAGVVQGPQTAELCIGSGSALNPVTGFLVQSPGTVYYKPMSAAGLRTVYQTYWRGPGTQYSLAGAATGGIPANPHYHASVPGMARVHVEFRASENVTRLAAVIVSYGGCGSIDDPVNRLPAVFTDYRTPGDWTTNLNYGSLPSPVQKDQFKSAVYQAGHTYSDLFGSAVDGPASVFPQIEGSSIAYSPGNLFSDPVVRTGFDCEGKATVRLTRLAALIAKQDLIFCGKLTRFSRHVTKVGWYTVRADAVRWNPSGSLPAGPLLSTKVSMSWHFRFAPVTGHVVNVQAAPVTVTRFQPQGLRPANQASGGSSTTVKVIVVRGGGAPVPTPRYRLRPVRVQASFDDGATWHTLAASAHGGYWLVHVTNPPSGYVSLRSIVTDVHGDSTTETVLRAYLVSNAA